MFWSVLCSSPQPMKLLPNVTNIETLLIKSSTKLLKTPPYKPSLPTYLCISVETVMLKPTKIIQWWVLHSHSHLQAHNEVHNSKPNWTHMTSDSSLHPGTPTPTTDSQQEPLKTTIAIPFYPSVGLCFKHSFGETKTQAPVKKISW